MLEAVWPDANVTEHALAQTMSELRQGPGDDAGAPLFLETVARRGLSLASRGAGDEDGRTIAVMDFVNVTGDADSEWLSAGIAGAQTRRYADQFPERSRRR